MSKSERGRIHQGNIRSARVMNITTIVKPPKCNIHVMHGSLKDELETNA